MNLKPVFSAMLAVCLPLILSAKTTWAPAGDHIRTRWAAEVSPKNVHAEYPRPQMVRKDWKSLNGLWDYAITKAGAESMPGADGQILVPFALESSLSGVAGRLTAEDALWYNRTFRVPCRWRRKKDVILHFGAVDWKCEVWVNGKSVGTHQGGYTAFEFNITPYLKRGRNTLQLKVLDATDNDMQPRGKQVLDTSKGRIWYTAVSGIWQTVWMEAVAKGGHIRDYKVAADIDAGTLTVTPLVKGQGEVKVELLEGAIGYDTEKPSQHVLDAKIVSAGAPAVFSVADPQLWGPGHPYLYGLRISLVKDGKTLDKVEAYTGLRKISVVSDAEGHKRMALNNKVLFQYGPLDQGWWQDGLYTAPTDEALKYDLDRTLDYGFNMLRKHIKVEPDRWFYHCDRLGMLVWQDMPCSARYKKNDWWAQGADVYDAGNSDQLSPEARENFLAEWKEIIDQHDKYPCIVVWVPFNEAWGQFDTKHVVDLTREWDGSRLINMASGGNWISGGVGDILDSHHYPEPKMRIWDEALVNVLGEYGGIGLSLEGHNWIVSEKNWGYGGLKENSEAATAQYEEYAKMLLPIVKEGCSAAVYTQTTDVERELNGFMTYDRAVDKLDPARVAAANREVIASLK